MRRHAERSRDDRSQGVDGLDPQLPGHHGVQLHPHLLGHLLDLAGDAAAQQLGQVLDEDVGVLDQVAGWQAQKLLKVQQQFAGAAYYIGKG